MNKRRTLNKYEVRFIKDLNIGRIDDKGATSTMLDEFPLTPRTNVIKINTLKELYSILDEYTYSCDLVFVRSKYITHVMELGVTDDYIIFEDRDYIDNLVNNYKVEYYLSM